MMKIAFLTRHDPTDIRIWSGTTYHFYHKLKERHEVEVIGPGILHQLRLLQMSNFPVDLHLPQDRYVACLGRLISERINRLGCDLVFFGDLIMIPLHADIPLVHLTDLTFEQAVEHSIRPDERDIEPCINLEVLLLNLSTRIIYPSEWIKNRASTIYNIDPSKMEVVEFGANIPKPRNYSIDINMDICRLVFIGVEWKRKNGEMMLQIFKVLKQACFPCSLTIIGSVPDWEDGEYKELKEDKDLTIIPRLDKSKKEDLERLCNILSESHFLVLPTKFDAFGIVFCEASAYGLPSITANVGGVGQAVKEGKNGFLLPPDATAEDYADKIKAVFKDKENYITLRQSSRKEYETRLNWDVWGDRVDKILEDAVAAWKFKKKNK